MAMVHPVEQSVQAAPAAPDPDATVPSLWQRRVVVPLVGQLRQGVTPEKLAESLAWGLVVGTFPILGTTTMLCGIAAVVRRLNHVAIQLVNWLIYPVQLLLILPFLQMGNRLFGYPPIELSVAEISAHFNQDFMSAVRDFGGLALRGIAAWGLVAMMVIPLLTWLLRQPLRRLPFHETAPKVRP